MRVQAKRFPVATPGSYVATLSSTSAGSVQVQGGPTAADEVAAFQRHRWADEALLLRGWDDAAQVPGALTPPLVDFTPRLTRLLGTCR